VRKRARPFAAGEFWGIALSDPGVSWNQKIDEAAITNNAVAVRATVTGR
jgi:hypothetical protein